MIWGFSKITVIGAAEIPFFFDVYPAVIKQSKANFRPFIDDFPINTVTFEGRVNLIFKGEASRTTYPLVL